MPTLAPTLALTPSPDRPRRPRWRWAAVIVVAVLVVFGRAAAFDFISFDDESLIVNNPLLRPLTAAHLRAIWSRPDQGLYVPATYTAWATLAAVATVPGPRGPAPDPAVFHLAGVVAHAANGVLVWLILRRLVASDSAAAVGALAFALHPLTAEPVAWASGFKDTFSGFWSLLAIALYLRGTRAAGVGATVAFAVALCAKPAAVAVPPIAWLAAWATGRRPAVAWPAIWIAMAVPYVILTQRQQADAAVMAWNPVAVRPLVVADAAATYARAVVWPVGLAVDYGRTPRWVWDHVGAATFGIVAAAAGMAAIASRRSRVAVAGVGVFVVAVGPVSGAVPFLYQQFSTVSDRYAYLPLLGVAMATAAAAGAAGRRWRWAATAVLVALAVTTFAQVGVWRDSASLFAHTLAVNPGSALADDGLGLAAERAGDLAAAEHFYTAAADLDPAEPRYADAVRRVLVRQGRAAEARPWQARALVAAADRVLRVDPTNPKATAALARAAALRASTRPTPPHRDR